MVLHTYNGGHRFGAYAGVSGVVMGVLGVAFVFGASVSGALPRRLRYRPAFSGWRPWSRGRIAMAASQVVTATLVLFLTVQATTAWGSLATVRDSRPFWESCATCTTTIFNAFDGQEGLEEAVEPYATAVRAVEPSGGVVLSWVRGVHRGDRFAPGDPSSNVIVANPEFIRRSEGRLPDPLRGADGPGEWGLLVPRDDADRIASIADEWGRYFRDPLSAAPNQATPNQPHIATYTPGEVFNFGQTDLRDQVFSDSPVIVVVSASAGLLDDDSYFAAGSAGDLLFTGDQRETQLALDTAGVERSVYVLDTLADQIGRGVAAARSKLPSATIGGVVALFVLFGGLMIQTRDFVVTNRDRLLLHRTLGRSPTRQYLRMCLRTTALLGCTGIVVIAVIGSGLTGADIVPRTLGIAFVALAALTISANAAAAYRLTTTKELLTDVH